MRSDPRNTAVYQQCLKLFVEHNGKNMVEIERQMREVYGHRNFHRRILYSRYKGNSHSPGWIDKYDWKRNADAPVRNASEARTSPASAPFAKARASARAVAEASHTNSFATTDLDVPPSLTVGLLQSTSGTQAVASAPFSSPRLGVSAVQTSPSFRSWLDRVSPGMNWHWRHLRLIQEYLELVTKGEIKRLMIFMPPRHGKSELVTVRYAAKRLADDPTMNLIIGSYNQRLANRFSRKVRRVLADSEILTAETQRRGETTGGDQGFRERAETIGSTGGNTSGSERACEKISSSPRLGVSAVPNSQPFRPANSLEEWETPQGGGVRAVGVGAGITGYGASLIIIDDPVKNRAEAESKTYRDKVWDWFNDDISTRLEPDGAMILIQTRWHEDDLAGRLINEMVSGGEQWDILALPAIAEDASHIPDSKFQIPNSEGSEVSTGGDTTVRERASDLESGIWNLEYRDPLGRSPGEALCPERFPIEELEKMRRRLGSYSFSALYQQRPTPLEGGLFKRAWFTNVIEKLPVGVKLVRAYDLAVSTKTTADFTASVLGGFDNRGNFYIADVMRRRLEFPEQKRFILDRMMREPHIQHGVELALHGQAIIQDLRRFAPTRATALRGIRVETDKVTRALTWAALAEEGKLFLVRGPYLRDFIEEASSFPNAKHDDQIDAVSLAISMTSQHKRYRHAGF